MRIILWGIFIGIIILNSYVFSCEESAREMVWGTSSGLSLQAFEGGSAEEYSDEIAHLRIDMFKEFPYLYEGSLECEKEYLNTYFRSKNSVVLLVFDQGKVVGFSNSIPLDEETEEIKKPFIQKGLNLKHYLYIGEAMLQPPYRSQGLLREFSEYHEAHALAKGFSNIVFMTVKRPSNHTSRPENYRPLEPIWQHYGYQLMEGIEINCSWKQIYTHQTEENQLEVWSKKVNK